MQASQALLLKQGDGLLEPESEAHEAPRGMPDVLEENGPSSELPFCSDRCASTWECAGRCLEVQAAALVPLGSEPSTSDMVHVHRSTSRAATPKPKTLGGGSRLR